MRRETAVCHLSLDPCVSLSACVCAIKLGLMISSSVSLSKLPNLSEPLFS